MASEGGGGLGGGRTPEILIDHAQALGRLTALARSSLPFAEPNADERAHQAFLRVRQAMVRRTSPRPRPPLPRDRRPPGVLRPRFRLWWIPAAVAAGMLLSLGTYQALRPGPLTYVVEGGLVGEGGYVRAPAAAETGVRFSDGTEVKLGRTSRGRVAWTSRRGARVMLDQGRARVKVVPRRGGQWVFDAGPCLVQVTGTRFDMRWSAGEQRLEVLLYDGSLTVQGPPAPRGIVMRQGQRLVMDVRGNSIKLDPMAVGGAVQTLDQALPPAPSEEPAAAAPVSSGVVTSPGATVQVLPGGAGRAVRGRKATGSWSARVLAGDFASVLHEARRRGIDNVLRSDGAPQVMALAQAARYSRQQALARRSLAAVRSRFPATPVAHKAAFLLGRMAEDDDGDLARALEWYGRYLVEAPGGAYQDEALGRRMTATQLLRGTPAARPLADEYLRRHPSGSYAKPARAILKVPR